VSGPVWRFERGIRASCAVCCRPGEEFFVEGEVCDNSLTPDRFVCPDCYRRLHRLVVAGEAGRPSTSPAYFGRR